MNNAIIFGLFALYVACVSLYLVLSGAQDALLELLRKFWGRTLGHSLYFVCNVALPVLICVLCIGWGVRHFDVTSEYAQINAPLHLDLENYRDLTPPHSVIDPDNLDVIYGA